MKTIVYVLLAVVFAVLWGFIGSRIMLWIFNRKIKKKIVKDIPIDKRTFFFNKKQYNLKGELEQELGQKKKKGLFNKKVKGGNEENDKNTIQPGSRGDSTPEATRGSPEEPTNPSASPGTSTGGPRDSISGNLLKKGRILD